MATKPLEKAFQEAAALPEDAQNEFAAWMLDELAHEEKWNRLLGESQDSLSRLAREALREHRRGKTESLNPDDL